MASGVLQIGNPPNPNVLQIGPSHRPIIGYTWDPVVDHTSFQTGALIDVLGIHVQAANVPSAEGTFLAVIAPSSVILFEHPGAPFQVHIPNDATLSACSL